MMKAEYNKQGAARKELADVISQITGEGVKYLFLPTKAYQIGSVLVGKDGTRTVQWNVKTQRFFNGLFRNWQPKDSGQKTRSLSWKKW